MLKIICNTSIRIDEVEKMNIEMTSISQNYKLVFKNIHKWLGSPNEKIIDVWF